MFAASGVGSRGSVGCVAEFFLSFRALTPVAFLGGPIYFPKGTGELGHKFLVTGLIVCVCIPDNLLSVSL